MALVFAALFGGCGNPDPCAGATGTCVAITVTSSQVQAVDLLELTTSGAVSGTRSSGLGSAHGLPIRIAVEFATPTGGAVHLSVFGKLQMALVGTGSTDLAIVPGGHTSASVDIEPESTNGDMAHPDVDGGGSDMAESCGRPGDPCCAGPFTPCGIGTACSAKSLTCEVNDLWVWGYDIDLTAGKIFARGMHFDGSTWTLGDQLSHGSSTQYYGNAIWGNQPSNFWGVGTEGSLWEWSGSAWLACSNLSACPAPATTKDLRAIYALSSSDMWIGGDDGNYHLENFQWVNKSDGLPSGFGTHNFWGVASDDLWAAGGSAIAHWDGSKWTADTSIAGFGIWGSAKSDVWVVGNNFIRHYDGMNWSPGYSVDGQPFTIWLDGISGTATDDVWAIGHHNETSTVGDLVHFDGKAWSRVPTPSMTMPSAIWAASKRQAWVVGGGEIWEWDGRMWSVVPLSTAQSKLWVSVFGSAKGGR